MPTCLGIVASGVSAGDTFIMPYHADWPAWSAADAVSGMTFTRTMSSAAIGGGYAGQNGAADADDGDYMDYLVSVDAGTYTLTALYSKGANNAIHDFVIDGVSVGTVGAYAASTTYNNSADIAGIALSAGLHTVRVKVTSKHASSGDFLLAPQWLTMTRTGA